MTVLGIVGCAEEKFTETSERAARWAIHRLIRQYKPTLVVSGDCPMGGIDHWAIEEAMNLHVPTKEFSPTRHQWSGRGGFMERNLQIADVSDVLANIVLDEYPPGFPNDKRFKICYHCKVPGHIKSGGCWTMLQAASRGKQTHLIIIPQHDYQWS